MNNKLRLIFLLTLYSFICLVNTNIDAKDLVKKRNDIFGYYPELQIINHSFLNKLDKSGFKILIPKPNELKFQKNQVSKTYKISTKYFFSQPVFSSNGKYMCVKALDDNYNFKIIRFELNLDQKSHGIFNVKDITNSLNFKKLNRSWDLGFLDLISISEDGNNLLVEGAISLKMDNHPNSFFTILTPVLIQLGKDSYSKQFFITGEVNSIGEIYEKNKTLFSDEYYRDHSIFNEVPEYQFFFSSAAISLRNIHIKIAGNNKNWKVTNNKIPYSIKPPGNSFWSSSAISQNGKFTALLASKGSETEGSDPFQLFRIIYDEKSVKNNIRSKLLLESVNLKHDGYKYVKIMDLYFLNNNGNLLAASCMFKKRLNDKSVFYYHRPFIINIKNKMASELTADNFYDLAFFNKLEN